MTAEELYELVKDWPREAWPWRGLSLKPEDRRKMSDGEGVKSLEYLPATWWLDWPIPVEVAVLLFEASGIRWLAREMRSVEFALVTNGDEWRIPMCWWPGMKNAKPVMGPTLIHTIAAAVRAVAADRSRTP